MRTTLLSITLGFLLACAGVLNSLTPELPFTVPAGSTTTGVNVNKQIGVSTTEVSFTNPDVDPTQLQADVLAELLAGGWNVEATPGTLAATRAEGESMTVTIGSAPDGGSTLAVVWTKQ